MVGVLGVGLVTMAAELTCYYSAGLLAFGLLWPRRPSIGIALCALSAAGWWIAGSGREWDEVFTGISLASVAFVRVGDRAIGPSHRREMLHRTNVTQATDA